MERFTHASQSQASLQKLNFGNRGEQSNVNKVRSLKIISWHFLHFSSLQYQHLFTLRAVVVHSGGINSGHYVTYRQDRSSLTAKKKTALMNEAKNRFILLNFRRGPLSMGSRSSSKWYCTSDDSVKPVQYNEVCKTPAYMLFYERISEEMQSHDVVKYYKIFHIQK